jgi:hypothetical protein
VGTVIGDILPVALGVAISPVPIIAVILMLLAPRAKAASVAFLLGWVMGIAVVVSVVTVVVDPVDDSAAADPSTFASILVLGVAAVALAVQQWSSRPRAGEEPTLPKWMAAIDTITPAKAAGLGALLSGLNPKNLILCLAGGVTIATGGLSSVETTVAVVIFVVIAAASVTLPVLAYLVATARIQQPLEELRVWLTANNATVMSVLMLVLGVAIFGKGLAGLV